MKCMLLVVVLALMILSSSAQQLQVLAGVNLARSVNGNTYGTVYGNMLPGVRLGVAADFTINSNLGIQPGLFFYQCGGRFPLLPEQRASSAENVTLRLNYLQLPVYITAHFDVTPATALSIGAGPYLAWRLNTPAYSLTNVRDKNQMKVYVERDNSENFRWLDMGLSFYYSFELRQALVIRMEVDYGVQNILLKRNDSMMRNQSFSCSMGYILRHRRSTSNKNLVMR